MSKNTSTEARLRVVIADHDPLARRVVRDVLQNAGVVVAAEAANARDAIDLAVYYRPDVVLMDAVLGGYADMGVTRTIIARCAEVKVVVLSVAADDALGIFSLRAGASGYLSKDMSLESLPRTLHGVMRGEIACSRTLVAGLVDHLRAGPTDFIGMRPVKSPLTSREWEILDLLCAAASTEQIADELVLSKETVRSHVKNLLRKLSVRSRQEAVAMAPSLRNPGRELVDRSLAIGPQLSSNGNGNGALNGTRDANAVRAA